MCDPHSAYVTPFVQVGTLDWVLTDHSRQGPPDQAADIPAEGTRSCAYRGTRRSRAMRLFILAATETFAGATGASRATAAASRSGLLNSGASA